MSNLFFRRYSLLSFSLVAALAVPFIVSSPARAQDREKEKERAKADRMAVSTVYVGDNVFVSNGRDKGELQKKVALEADNMPVIDAIKKVAEQAGIACEIDADVPTDKMVTVTMKNVPLSLVLGYLTSEGNIGWSYTSETRGDKQESKIKITKSRWRSVRVTSPATPFAPAPPVATFDSKQFHEQMAEAMRMAQSAARPGQAYTIRALSGSRLPDTKVKLDVRNSNIRDALKDVLKQAGLDYALEDDVPDDVKRSFTFENVPIGTALDVICRSAEIGWTVQRTGLSETREAARNEKKPKITVLIGKKYARPTAALFGAVNSDMLSPLPAISGLLDAVAPAALDLLDLPEIPEMDIDTTFTRIESDDV